MSSDKAILNSASSSFSFLEYYLQISLHATTARIQQAWALSNPHLTLNFEGRCKDILSLDAWIDCESLVSPNGSEEVCKRGFVIAKHQSTGDAPPSATDYVKVNVGSLKSYIGATKGKITKKLLLCKVGVGRSYFADEEYAKIGTIPEGYDSFYISQPKDYSSISESSEYHHTYLIKDSSQILPLYEVVFDFDPEWEKKSREKSYCDNCEKQVATVYCGADAAYLCNACDTSLHSNKLTCRHIRTPIGKGVEGFGNCRQHPDKTVEFFCPTCHVPVCVYCKMVGHHSSGEASRHKLVSVTEAYTSVLESSHTSDPILQSRKNAIENQLSAITARAKLVEKNSTEVKQVIEDLYKRALAELKVITKKKLTILKGDECELYRQLGEMKRLESFLGYQQQGGDRTQFLLNWGRHLQLRAELHAFRFFRDNIDVYADIKCGGSIHVHLDSSVSTGANISTSNSSGNGAVNATGTLGGHHGSGAGNLIKALPHTSTLTSTLTLNSKKNQVYDAITMGKGPRVPGSKPMLGKSVSEAGVKVRRTSDFFAETLHALDLGSESLSEVNETESEA